MCRTPWFDESVYPREFIDWERIEDFAAIMRETGWGKFPPIKVGRDSGRIYDGVHRFHAAEKAGVLPLTEFVDDPTTPLEQLALGAELNAVSSKQLSMGEKRSVLRKVYDSSSLEGIDHGLWAERLGLAKAMVKQWILKFVYDDAEKANAVALAAKQDTPEIAEAKRMLHQGEKIVTRGGELFYRGSYSPSTPREAVEYKKQTGSGVIDYSSVRVEGQEVPDLVMDLRRIARRVGWVGEAPIFSAMTLDDVALFSECAAVLSRAATAKKSGSGADLN